MGLGLSLGLSLGSVRSWPDHLPLKNKFDRVSHKYDRSIGQIVSPCAETELLLQQTLLFFIFHTFLTTSTIATTKY